MNIIYSNWHVHEAHYISALPALRNSENRVYHLLDRFDGASTPVSSIKIFRMNQKTDFLLWWIIWWSFYRFISGKTILAVIIIKESDRTLYMILMMKLLSCSNLRANPWWHFLAAQVANQELGPISTEMNKEDLKTQWIH